MLKLSDSQAVLLRNAVALARSREGMASRVQAVYAEVQREIDIRRPRCDRSGRCCRFEEYGHRLFVTTAELAAFVSSSLEEEARVGGGLELKQRLRMASHPSPKSLPQGEGGCPYQIDKLCSVHTIRPFGCRVFFCDPDAQEWQQGVYETFHLRLRQLHQEMDIPYLYVEWLEALRAIGLPD